ncbi:MAG: IS5 family transposase [Roseivirga sp.]
MPRIDNSQRSFADQCLEQKINPLSTIARIDQIIDWQPIQQLLDQAYPKGLEDRGRKAYNPLILFKMSLLQIWYGLSDTLVEEQTRDRLSFMAFCGVKALDPVPDSTLLCRFRKKLTQTQAYDRLLEAINRQLEQHELLVCKGTIVDASITPTARRPKGKKVYAFSEGEYRPPLEEVKQKGVDQEASWVKRGNELYYGYKRHYLVEAETGLVLSVHTSKASEHESQHLSRLLEQVELPKGSEVLGDKGYSSASNESLLESKGLKSRLQRKRARGKARNSWLSLYNRLIGERRYKVERVFGSIKSWFKAGSARYVGKAKTHSQHVLEALCYNLYRAPGLALRVSVG